MVKAARPGYDEPVMTKVQGFTFIEIVVVLAILGALMMISIPSISHTLEIRALDNTASDIFMSLETAKWQAAAAKLNHRVRFSSDDGAWTYRVEKESSPGVWTTIAGAGPKKISTKFTFTPNLPTGQAVVFLATGFVSNYDSLKNSITLESPKLRTLGEPSQRVIRIFAGGSVRYLKS
jgi:prepilin-type N-terminal cleavage/methylation domain-containing protein